VPIPNHIILFDGVCNLCNGVVQFIIKRDRSDKFRFASLQSKFGVELLKNHGIPACNIDTVVYIQNGKFYSKSTAALKILNELGGSCSLIYVFILLPKPIRDIAYSLVAKYHYRIFGKQESCMIPTNELKDKFLN
jgi:predicted DCC family thiol-disulfide oxidoreductase YuxK